jgi:Transposase protein
VCNLKHYPVLHLLSITYFTIKPLNLPVRYVRNVFHLALPHESVLRSWASSVDGTPGFTAQSFAQLQQKVEEEKAKGQQVVIQLVLDEMAIRRHVQFDGNKFIGRV